MAQTIENFESIGMNKMDKGAADVEFKNESINLSSLKRGMYIVTFVDKDGSSTSQKMIKE